MSSLNLTMLVSSKPSLSSASPLSFRSGVSSSPFPFSTQNSTPSISTKASSSVIQIQCGLRELRDRIDSVKNTQKITEAMKLVAAAKVRRAQEAVVNGRPFSETLVEVLYNINEQLQTEDVDTPLANVRPVKKVALVVITGDRGLCGGFNNMIIKKAEARIRDLTKLGLDYTVISVGKKGNSYFLRSTNTLWHRNLQNSFVLPDGDKPLTHDPLLVRECFIRMTPIYSHLTYIPNEDQERTKINGRTREPISAVGLKSINDQD